MIGRTGKERARFSTTIQAATRLQAGGGVALKRIVALAVAILSVHAAGCRSRKSVLGSEMQRLGVRSALVVASQSLDEHPIWSPDGRFLAVNVDGGWKRIDLSSIQLIAATWRKDQPIGAPQPPAKTSKIGESRVRNWERTARFGPRRVVTREGTTVELKLGDLGTALTLTRQGGQPETLWTSAIENCYGLALAPDDKSVAYICEQNGVVVTGL